MMQMKAALCMLLAQTTSAFVVQVQTSPLAPLEAARTVPQKTVSQLSMSMKPLYDTLCSKVTDKLGLQVTHFCETFEAATWSGNDATGTAAWLSETSPQYLTGVSTCTTTTTTTAGVGRAEELMLNVWMGPSYDVPHLLVTFGLDQGNLYHVTADYVPRGAIVMGSDPQYLQAFYDETVQQAWTDASAAGQALGPAPEFELRLLDSPAKIAVTGLTAASAEAIVVAHVDRFLAWVEQAQQVPARLRGSFNMRDDKIRQYYYRGQVAKQAAALGGDLGMTVAAVNTGPTAEAYVGGGS